MSPGGCQPLGRVDDGAVPVPGPGPNGVLLAPIAADLVMGPTGLILVRRRVARSGQITFRKLPQMPGLRHDAEHLALAVVLRCT